MHDQKQYRKVSFLAGVSMKFYNVYMVLLLFCSQMVLGRLEILDTNPQDVELLSIQEMRFCYISFVRINGKKYIIKQKKSDCLRKLVGVVRDAVMAHCAENFIDAHLVDIIPAGKEFPGKPRKDWPATIHTIAPGKMIKDQNSRFNHMNIKQAAVGFRYDMLEWMAKDATLIKIVAFDTVLCNHDRHRGNLFYNAKTDSFCAIDMDSACKYNLCALACQNFTAMLNNRKLQLSGKELRVLIEYKKHLQFLIDHYQPEDRLALYDYFAQKAGFVEGSPIYLPKFVLEMEHNKEVIIASYQDAQKLVKIVGQLIEKTQKSLK